MLPLPPKHMTHTLCWYKGAVTPHWWLSYRARRVALAILTSAILGPWPVRAGWKIDSNFRPLIEGDARVYSIVPTPDGKVVIAGFFTEVDGVPRRGLARLHADGTIDTTFVPDLSVSTFDPGGYYVAAVQPDKKVVIAHASRGSLRVAGGSRPIVTRFNADGSRDTSFVCDTRGICAAHAIQVMHDGRILVARWAWQTDYEQSLLCFLPTGALDTSFPNAYSLVSGAVLDLDLLADNQIVATGFLSGNQIGAVRLDEHGSMLAQFSAPGAARDPLASAIGDDGSAILLANATAGGLSLVPTLIGFDATGSEKYTHGVGEPEPRAPVDHLRGAILSDTGGTLVLGFHGAGALHTLEHITHSGVSDNALSVELGEPGGMIHTMSYDANGAVLVGGRFTGADRMAYTCAFRLRSDTPPARLANISARGYVGPGDHVLIAGFVVSGSEPQRILIRAISENLARFDLSGLAGDVRLSVYPVGANRPPIHQAESWPASATTPDALRAQYAANRVGAFPLLLPGGGVDSTDTATALTLDPGGYTVVVESTEPGVGLVEIYDANGVGADRKLVNISSRARVGTENERIIAGFVIDGGPKRVLARAIGPGIAGMVSDTLTDPVIELFRQSDGARLHVNDNWGEADNASEIDAASRRVTGLHPASGSADAALLVDLPAGAYTMVVSGKGGEAGIALAEVYEIP